MTKEQLQGVYDKKKGPIDLNKALGITEEEIKRAVAVKHTIDVNKRKKFMDEPRFTK